jgi:hypothetical protein
MKKKKERIIKPTKYVSIYQRQLHINQKRKSRESNRGLLLSFKNGSLHFFVVFFTDQDQEEQGSVFFLYSKDGVCPIQNNLKVW